MTKIKGRAWKFGDGVSTDHIAPGRYFHLRSNLPELAKHVLQDARGDFALSVKSGDFVVAGKNFGQGSSREHAPAIIKMAGAGAVLAKSFARIFFRNAINVGLPAIVCDTDLIDEGDELEVDLETGVVRDLKKRSDLKFSPLPPVMMKVLSEGGLVNYVVKHGGLKV